MSSNEEAQVAQRRANLEAIVALGFRAYPNKFTTTHTVSALVTAHGESEAAALEASRVETIAAGRVVSIRNFGKASFLVLSDGRSRIQVYVRQDSLSERDYQLSRLLDFGDQIGVAGHLFRTKTNELSIWATSLEFLAKCFLPLPEKWHGLQDVETRYRQRYLDLIVNPDVRRVFEVRSRTVTAVRDFLTSQGFLEVETPMMQPIAGGALARPFVTHHNALDMKLFLRIAPELYLKRLTVGGIERVFEINRNFRNEGISTQHNPEFTMLEFYWAYVDYQVLMRFTEELLSFVARAAIGTEQLTFGEHEINLQAPFRRLSLRHAAAEEASRATGRHRAGRRAAQRGLGARDCRAPRHRGVASRRRRQGGHRDLRAALGASADPADVHLRLPDGGLAAVEAARGRSRHGRALRALHRRLRSRQRLQRAQRSGRAAPPLRSPARTIGPRATPRPTRWTTTMSGRSSTACRRPAARASASIGW